MAVGWLINMTLEPGSDFEEEGVPFDKAIVEVGDKDGASRMNLVTWDISSVLTRFTPVLPTSVCLRT